MIKKLLDYYAGDKEFFSEISRGVKEFFGIRDGKKSLETDEREMGLLNEWLVYDFVLKNGKSLLQDFYDRNPLKLADEELSEYKDLQTSEYGMFEVLKVEIGRGLRILNLQNNNNYYAHEFKATFAIEEGYVFLGRVGKIKDCWELVGADPFVWGTEFDEAAKKEISAVKEKLTPKIARDVFLGKRDEREDCKINFESEKININEAREKLRSELIELGIYHYAKADLIEKWISDFNWKRGEIVPASIASILLSLVNDDITDEDSSSLMLAVGNFYNAKINESLKEGSGGKQEEKSGKIKHTEVFIGSQEWLEYYLKAYDLMIDRKEDQSLKYYNKSFEILLRDRVAKPDIYRIFANKAVAHFSVGQEEEGIRLLEMALSLNSNYDFARSMLEKYEDGEMESVIFIGKLKEMKKIFKRKKSAKGRRKRYKKGLLSNILENGYFEKDPARAYFKFLKDLGINFATENLTVSNITTIGSDGEVTESINKNQDGKNKTGRNDPCSCGAAKPDGKPVKYKHCHGKNV